MKTTLFSALTIFFAVSALNVNAQSAGKSGDEAAVLKFWNDVFAAYDSGNEAQMWAAYDPNACEMFPDGNHVCTLATLKASYEQFVGMLDGKPSWKPGTPDIHLVDANNAFILAEIVSDIKLKGGQQIGGKTKFVVFVHKSNGAWHIVYDGETPIVPMPGN